MATAMNDLSQAPACPFCAAPWTARMLEQFDLHAGGASCACCAGTPRAPGSGAAATPDQDLCCEACDKPIYRIPRAGRLHD